MILVAKSSLLRSSREAKLIEQMESRLTWLLIDYSNQILRMEALTTSEITLTPVI